MRRDWRAAGSLFGLLSGLFFARESLKLFWEDVGGTDTPTPTHNRYGWISTEHCRAGWQEEGQELQMAEICHSHPYGIEYLVAGLLIVSMALLIWIWWKPLKI